MERLGLFLCLLVLAGSFDEMSAHFRDDYDTIIQAYASTKPVEDWDVTIQYPKPARAREYNIQPGEEVDVGSSRDKGNPIDDCWRSDPNWPYNRQALAYCGVGFGAKAMGGANGPIYVVTDDTDADLVNPAPGTLRYGVLQDGPLWIGFSRDMNIKLQNELIMTSFKTIDGRGFSVHISGGAGLTLQYISNVILHGVHIHDLKATGPAVIRSNVTHVGHRKGSDGDAVNIFGSRDIWVDHCYFARGPDGLVDAVMGSTAVTVSNNYFEQHDKVMLFGAHPYDTMDQGMQITVAFNHFGRGLIERIPRVRHGNVHVLNNFYEGWGMYAIGGSEGPTIVSEGNIFNAPDTNDKQVTKRIDDGDPDYKQCLSWNWLSEGDLFLNGAYFVSGGAAPGSYVYSKAVSTASRVPVDKVGAITRDAGPLACSPNAGIC
ncbi:hypothetical protein KC19_12G120300 [Ceratodon purpureus]|uniref:Pectate lyase n=1 Tax=Ceratodon purpureus TaxID=3225 RepID=A0A8T0GC35_CERPU|nr:hypothetical protein KC19_12G120300 [Ceratodon purpureus]